MPIEINSLTDATIGGLAGTENFVLDDGKDGYKVSIGNLANFFKSATAAPVVQTAPVISCDDPTEGGTIFVSARAVLSTDDSGTWFKTTYERNESLLIGNEKQYTITNADLGESITAVQEIENTLGVTTSRSNAIIPYVRIIEEGYQLADIATFTRASTATYFDENGVLQVAAQDEPRFEWEEV